MNDPQLDELIAAWLEGRISESESELLQQRLRESKDARNRFRALAKVDVTLREISSEELSAFVEDAVDEQHVFPPISPLTPAKKTSTVGSWVQIAIGIAASLLVGVISYKIGRENGTEIAEINAVPASEISDDTVISGHATLRRSAGVRWSAGSPSFRQGDVVPEGLLSFDQGVAEIDLFCGASIVVEGPAKLLLESDWSVRCLAGRLRASVPPAAQGFVIKVEDSEIVDLGTEFTLEVGQEHARVEVVDGEIALRGGKFDGDHLLSGEGKALVGESDRRLEELSTTKDVYRMYEVDLQARYENWKQHTHSVRQDPRLIAYYPIAEASLDRFIVNQAPTGNQLDGKLVGLVEEVEGRFGDESVALDFRRPGARVRTRIEGEFSSFTLACWVRIDSLEHAYNSLFMSDGYENGEPHWQIDRDGSLLFSVMVDDTPGAGLGPAPDARLHRIYRTPPFWDVSKSGQWFHLAAVYDPERRTVSQYVNGRQVASESITDQYFISTLRIGAAEIGNWGQPFRNSPWFSVRNLNGAIDELALFDAALSEGEVHDLFELGKPLDY